jgi:hypothetical protein
MPALTLIDHVTSKSIVLTVYDSIRLYTRPDGTKLFLNIDEFRNIYIKDQKKNNPRPSKKDLKSFKK